MAKTAAPKKRVVADAITLKITLLNVKPPVWRRIVVPRSMTLDDLHTAIQIAMGWDGGHLHDFDVAGERYGDPSTTDDVEDEGRLMLDSIVASGINRVKYTYDFGDDWQHAILIEKRPPPDAVKAWPACIGGANRCPPEDCGGPWGYAEVLEIFANPAHPRHDEQLEWIGEDFDPENFSVAEVDASLATAFRRNARAAS